MVGGGSGFKPESPSTVSDLPSTGRRRALQHDRLRALRTGRPEVHEGAKHDVNLFAFRCQRCRLRWAI